MSIIIFYEQKLNQVLEKKERIKAQIDALRDKLNANSPNNKMWMEWWQEKTDLNNQLCELIGSEKHYEQKIDSLKNL